MFATIRNSILLQVVWGFLCLHALNCSINVNDYVDTNGKEDLSINEQESIIEFILEKVLGDEDAVEEYEEHDNDDHTSKKVNEFKLFLGYNQQFTTLESEFIRQSKHAFFYLHRPAKAFHDPVNPPPRFV